MGAHIRPRIRAIKEIFGVVIWALKAKPIIDMMPVVRDIEKIDCYNYQMTALGYEPCGEFGIFRQKVFQKRRQ